MTATAGAPVADVDVAGPPGMASAWVVEFPRGVFDRCGATITPGALVRVLDGEHEGKVAEVTGWGGSRGVEVVMVEEEGDGAVAADRLQVLGEEVAVLRRTLAGATVVEEPPTPTVVVHPVGGQDVILARPGVPGPFPDPRDFESRRPPTDQVKVDARRWGEACLAVLDGCSQEERQRLVADWLAAPLLERVLNEGPLPATIDRLCFVVTDQGESDFSIDDTANFGELLTLWVAGTASRRRRVIGEVIAPIVLRRAPHISDEVTSQVRTEMRRLRTGVGQIVVVQAGGTPAMAVGITFAVVLDSVGREVRQLYVPRGEQPLRAVDLPGLIRRTSTYPAARNFLDRRQPGAAREVLITPAPFGEPADLAGVVEVLAHLARRDLAAARAARSQLAPLAGLGQPGSSSVAAIDAALDLVSPGDVSALLMLAAWDAIAAAGTRAREPDPDLLVSQLAAIDDNLAAQWFVCKGGVDPTDVESLRAFFPGHDWTKFGTCRVTGDKEGRDALASSRPPQRPIRLTAANEVFSCIATGTPCELRQHRSVTPELRSAAKGVLGRRVGGELRKLRNSSRLIHGVSPIAVGQLERALEADRIRPDVKSWLKTLYQSFDLDLRSDALGVACRAVGERLRQLS